MSIRPCRDPRRSPVFLFLMLAAWITLAGGTAAAEPAAQRPEDGRAWLFVDSGSADTQVLAAHVRRTCEAHRTQLLVLDLADSRHFRTLAGLDAVRKDAWPAAEVLFIGDLRLGGAAEIRSFLDQWDRGEVSLDAQAPPDPPVPAEAAPTTIAPALEAPPLADEPRTQVEDAAPAGLLERYRYTALGALAVLLLLWTARRRGQRPRSSVRPTTPASRSRS